MTAFYSYQGQVPTELPKRIRLSDGSTRTDPSSFTEEEIADAGFTGPYYENPPSYDPNIETLTWNRDTEEWGVENIVDEETIWEAFRSRRNDKLINSDWTQLSDNRLTDAKKSEWESYRQELRDLPSNTLDPKNITWPSQPE